MLTQLQGKVGLLRQLGFVSATALVVSNMVGMGIFTTTGIHGGGPGQRQTGPGGLGGGRAVRPGRRAQLFRAGHQLSQLRRRIRVPHARLRPGLGLHDRMGLLLRRLLRAHRGGGAGVLGLSGILLSSAQQGHARFVLGSGTLFHSSGRRAIGGLPADRGLQRSELLGRAAHRPGAERADGQ